MSRLAYQLLWLRLFIAYNNKNTEHKENAVISWV